MKRLAAFAILVAGCSSSSPAPSNETANAAPPSSGKTPANAASASSAIDLGTAATGAPLSFDVPAGALGFWIVVDATTGPDVSIGVAELVDANGATIVSDLASTRHRPVGTGVSTFIYPPVADAATAVSAGRWKVKLGGDSADPTNPKGSGAVPWTGDVHAVVYLQTSPAGDGAFTGGALDLDLYVPPGLVVGDHSIDAASAPNDPALAERIDAVFSLESNLYGIGRGEVRFHPVDASVKSISGQDAVDTANTLAVAQGDGPSAQIVLTNVLEPDGAGNGEIGGITNCLPGALGRGGTKCSAVIASLRGSAQDDATTIVHELGHFIGLEHTTELGGDVFDELSDTPKCTNMAKNALASCPDFTNLMFPTSLANEEHVVVVSPTQARIMHASPLYRAAGR